MKKGIILIGFILLSLLVQAQQSSSITDRIRQFISRAKEAYSMGNYQDALSEYQKAQKLAPDLADLYKAIGAVCEKLGSDEYIKAAIDNYKQYLNLATDATDKDDIQDRISALEYRYEVGLKQTKIMDDISGIWISNWTEHDNSIFAVNKDKPFAILEIQEIGKTGEYRVTINSNSKMYQETIIDKVVKFRPVKDNSFQFTYADSKIHNPSSALYDGLHAVLDATGGNKLLQGVGKTIIEYKRENDLPSNTQTAYYFQLKYDNGKLKGYLNVKGEYAAQSGAGTIQSNQDQLYEINFTKDDNYFDFGNNTYVEFANSTLYFTNNMGHRKAFTIDNWKMLSKPQFHSIKSGLHLQTAGAILLGVGLGTALGAQLFRIRTNDQTENDIKSNEAIANYGAIIGGGLSIIGIPMIISANHKIRKAVNEYNNSLRHKNEHSLNLKFGVTPTGGLGLVLNF